MTLALVRALVIADRDPSPAALRELLAAGPDLVLLLGDLRGHALSPLAEFPGPILGVYGNHDDGERYLSDLGGHDLHARGARWRGVTFVGLGGCVRYKPHGRWQFTQEQAQALVARLRRLPRPDVVVCHCPPAGVNDDPYDHAHRGWTALRAFVQDTQPRLLVHGHTYPLPEEQVTSLGRTRVEYVSGARLIEL